MAVLALGAAGCVSFRPMAATLHDKPLSLERLRPAVVDSEASQLTLEARPGLELKADILRLQIADALNGELNEASVDRRPVPARFRAKVVATESNNAWAVALSPFTLVWAVMLPFVNVSVHVELELELGGVRYAAAGTGDQNVSAAGPKVVAEALEAALGLALNDALGKLQAEPRAVSAAEPR